MKVLIADDESIVLEGLQCIIDWESLGFSILSLAKNGEETLDKILNLQPDLVVLDIRMPKLTGIEIIQIAREKGFEGHFIILSGYSDFTYAQTAIKYGVDFYLTKPIDEEELENAVTMVRNFIENEKKTSITFHQYRENARDTIIRNIITGHQKDYSNLNLKDFYLSTDLYQVVIYERYNKEDVFQSAWDFAELLRVSNEDHNTFDPIVIDKHNFVLLKGELATERFERLLSHYAVNPQKGSPLDSLFLAYGRKVYRPEDIVLSYRDSCLLLNRRFFCKPKQYVLGYESLPNASEYTDCISDNLAKQYAAAFSNYIQTQNRSSITELMNELQQKLFFSIDDVSSIKHFLIDIYLQIKHKISHTYEKLEMPFSTNSSIIDLIESKYYLYEIVEILMEQFEICMNALGSPSSEGIMDNILYYINHNYTDNLKLETIAPLFGYNSAYLGKIFTKQVGESFNSYLDRVRIDHSKELLQKDQLKVYEIAERVGYKNVDYFHKKFKKYVGESPAEYRKHLL